MPETILSAHNAHQAAEQLAVNCPLETLMPLFERYGTMPDFIELLACLLQELVLRGEVNAEISPVPLPLQKFQDYLVNLRHPLSWLPLHTVPAESEHEYDLRQLKGLYATSGLGASPQNQTDLLANPPHFSELTTEATDRRLVVPFDSWKTEAREMGLSRVLSPDEFSAHLLSLAPLDCLAGSPVEKIRPVAIAATEAWEILFARVPGEGLFSDGPQYAYARLNAWQALAALAGCASETVFADVAARVEACHFWLFDTSGSSWSFQYFNDIGMAALRPDGRTMAFVAATQID